MIKKALIINVFVVLTSLLCTSGFIKQASAQTDRGKCEDNYLLLGRNCYPLYPDKSGNCNVRYENQKTDLSYCQKPAAQENKQGGWWDNTKNTAGNFLNGTGNFFKRIISPKQTSQTTSNIDETPPVPAETGNEETKQVLNPAIQYTCNNLPLGLKNICTGNAKKCLAERDINDCIYQAKTSAFLLPAATGATAPQNIKQQLGENGYENYVGAYCDEILGGVLSKPENAALGQACNQQVNLAKCENKGNLDELISCVKQAARKVSQTTTPGNLPAAGGGNVVYRDRVNTTQIAGSSISAEFDTHLYDLCSRAPAEKINACRTVSNQNCGKEKDLTKFRTCVQNEVNKLKGGAATQRQAATGQQITSSSPGLTPNLSDTTITALINGKSNSDIITNKETPISLQPKISQTGQSNCLPGGKYGAIDLSFKKIQQFGQTAKLAKPIPIAISKPSDASFKNCTDYSASVKDPGVYELIVSYTLLNTSKQAKATLTVKPGSQTGTKTILFACQTLVDGKQSTANTITAKAQPVQGSDDAKYNRVNWYIHEGEYQSGKEVIADKNSYRTTGMANVNYTYKDLKPNTKYTVAAQYYTEAANPKDNRPATICSTQIIQTPAKKQSKDQQKPNNLAVNFAQDSKVLAATAGEISFDVNPLVYTNLETDSEIVKIHLQVRYLDSTDKDAQEMFDGDWENGRSFPVLVSDPAVVAVEANAGYLDLDGNFQPSIDTLSIPVIQDEDEPATPLPAPQQSLISLNTNNDLQQSIDQIASGIETDIPVLAQTAFPVDFPRFLVNGQAQDAQVSLCNFGNQGPCTYGLTIPYSSLSTGRMSILFADGETSFEKTLDFEVVLPTDDQPGITPSQIPEVDEGSEDNPLVEVIIFKEADVDNVYPGIIWENGTVLTSEPFELKVGKNVFKIVKKYAKGDPVTESFVVERTTKTPPAQEQVPLPEPQQDLACSPGDYKKECTGNCSGCGPGAGEVVVYQCKVDRSGFEEIGSECGDCPGVCSPASAGQEDQQPAPPPQTDTSPEDTPLPPATDQPVPPQEDQTSGGSNECEDRDLGYREDHDGQNCEVFQNPCDGTYRFYYCNPL